MKMTKRVRQLKAKDIQDIDIIIIEEVEVDTVVINIIDDTHLLHQNHSESHKINGPTRLFPK